MRQLFNGSLLRVYSSHKTLVIELRITESERRGNIILPGRGLKRLLRGDISASPRGLVRVDEVRERIFHSKGAKVQEKGSNRTSSQPHPEEPRVRAHNCRSEPWRIITYL